MIEDADNADEEPGEKHEASNKSGWPEEQKDVAPSAQIVPAQRCLQRHVKKLSELINRFQDYEQKPENSLTELQKGSGPENFNAKHVSMRVWILQISTAGL